MNGIDYIKTKQILWAKRAGISLLGSQGSKGMPIYTETIEQNLFEPLTNEVTEQFKSGDGNELYDNLKTAAKMKALHSSSAIAVNIFQYWDKRNKVNQIAHACGLCYKENLSAIKVKFEVKYKISNSFQYSPNIDVVIENNKDSRYRVYAIECKFSEAYGSYSQKGLDPKYLDLQIWDDIPFIHNFAKSICPHDNHFKHLQSAQLVKHILGLKNKYGKMAFRLFYLYYDVLGEEGCLHKKEIEEFASVVKNDNIKFSAISYQMLISNLFKNYYEGNEKYLDYIADRYL
jgi:hypothetical protein